MSYNTTIIEKIFRGHTMAVFANPPLPPLNGPLCRGAPLLCPDTDFFGVRCPYLRQMKPSHSVLTLDLIIRLLAVVCEHK